MCANGKLSFVHCVRYVVLRFGREGISDGLFDSSDVLLCINYGEITCMACLCGSKCLRRVYAGFAQGLRRVYIFCEFSLLLLI